MSGNVVPRAILKQPLSNGIGRHIKQLQRLTFKFCKARPDSLGVRDFIDNGLVDFCKANPGTAFYLKPRRHRSPILVAEYLNGNWQYIRTAGMTSMEISRWVEHLATRNGENIVPIYKPWTTTSPSVQGVWHPELNGNPDIVPIENPRDLLHNPKLLKDASKYIGEDDSASSRLVELFKQQQYRLDE